MINGDILCHVIFYSKKKKKFRSIDYFYFGFEIYLNFIFNDNSGINYLFNSLIFEDRKWMNIANIEKWVFFSEYISIKCYYD